MILNWQKKIFNFFLSDQKKNSLYILLNKLLISFITFIGKLFHDEDRWVQFLSLIQTMIFSHVPYFYSVLCESLVFDMPCFVSVIYAPIITCLFPIGAHARCPSPLHRPRRSCATTDDSLLNIQIPLQNIYLSWIHNYATSHIN